MAHECRPGYETVLPRRDFRPADVGRRIYGRKALRPSDFGFELPESLIAQAAVEPRSAARLRVHDRAAGTTQHLHVRDLPSLLQPGDLLVLNDTRVLPHRLVGRRPSGARVEVLVLERHPDAADSQRSALCEGFVKPARKVVHDAAVPLEDGSIELLPVGDLGGGRLRFRLRTVGEESLDAALDRVGRAPLPPYIRRPDDEDRSIDRARYQTVFAENPGAVAAPTAGLHFDEELFAALAERGVERCAVTLHVGEGTFAPVRVEDVASHEMHAEVYEVPESVAEAVRRTRARRGRVIAVGTTSVRSLESCARDDGTVDAGSGETKLFLYPGRPLRVCDAVWTNFHLPESTLMMLLAAFVGRDRLLAEYERAIEEGYRFYSFGDASLWL